MHHLRCEGQTHTSVLAVDVIVTAASARAAMAEALTSFLDPGVASAV